MVHPADCAIALRHGRVGSSCAGRGLDGGLDRFCEIVYRLCGLLRGEEGTASSGREGRQICEQYRAEFTPNGYGYTLGFVLVEACQLLCKVEKRSSPNISLCFSDLFGVLGVSSVGRWIDRWQRLSIGTVGSLARF